MSVNRQEPSFAHRVMSGGAWILAGSAWQVGLGFIANIFLTRLLFPAAFGEFALAMFFAQLLRVQSKLGLRHAFAQSREQPGDLMGTYFVTEGAAALAGVVLVLLASPLLTWLGYSQAVVHVTIALSIVFFLEGLAGIASTLLSRELRFAEISTLDMTLFPLSYIPAFWLATHGGGVWSIVAHSATYNLLLTPLIWLIVHRRMAHFGKMNWRFEPDLCRGLLKFGASVGFGIFAAMLLTQLDNFFIGTFVGVAILGLYDRAYRIAEWPGMLLNNVISHSVFFTYARLQDDRVNLEKMVTIVIWAILSLTLPLALAVFIVAPDLLLLLYGPRWVGAALFLRILIAYAAIRPLWEHGGVFFIAMGKPGMTARCNVIQVLILIAVGLPFTLLWGAVGTCAAVGIAFGTGIIVLHTMLGKEIPIKPVRLLAMPVLALLLTLLGYFIFDHFAGLDNLAAGPRIAFKAAWVIISFYGFTFLAQPSVVLSRVHSGLKLLAGKG